MSKMHEQNLGFKGMELPAFSEHEQNESRNMKTDAGLEFSKLSSGTQHIFKKLSHYPFIVTINTA